MVWYNTDTLNRETANVHGLVQQCLSTGGIVDEFADVATSIMTMSTEFDDEKVFYILCAMTVFPTIKRYVDSLNEGDSAITAITDKYTDMMPDKGYMLKYWKGAKDPLRTEGTKLVPGNAAYVPVLVEPAPPSGFDTSKWFFERWDTNGDRIRAAPGTLPRHKGGTDTLRGSVKRARDDSDEDYDSEDKDKDHDNDSDSDDEYLTLDKCAKMLARVVNLQTTASVFKRVPHPRLPPQNSDAVTKIRHGSGDTMFQTIKSYVTAMCIEVFMEVENVTQVFR